MAADTLARAYEVEDQRDAALVVLDRVSKDRAHILDSYPGAYWILLEAHRAQLLVQMGRGREATDIVARIRRLLALADPDVAVLKSLGQLEERLAPSSPPDSSL